jgi:hypothetical protein
VYNKLFGEGWDPAGAVSDAAGAASQIFGPRVVKAGLDAIPARMGKYLHESAWNFPKNLSARSKGIAANSAWNNGIDPVYGKAAEGQAAKAETFRQAAEDQQTQDLRKYNNTYESVANGLVGIVDLIHNYEKAGWSEGANQLRHRAFSYLEEHTGISPRKAGDKVPLPVQGPPGVVAAQGQQLPPKFRTLVADESLKDYFNRVLAEETPKNLPYYQGVKQALGRIESSKLAQMSPSQAIAEASDNDTFNRLTKGNLRKTVERSAPEVQLSNDVEHNYIIIRDALQDMSKKNPKMMVELLPYLGAGATGGVLATLGLSHSGVPLALAGAGSVATLAMGLAHKSLKDPVFRGKLGRYLGNYGRSGPSGAMMEFLGQLPKATILGSSPRSLQQEDK